MRKRANKQEFYLNDEELELLYKKMETCGIENKSEYLRRMALSGYIIKPDYEPVKKLTYEINKIGTTLNQIAKKINSTDRIWEKELAKARKEIHDLWLLHMLRVEEKEKVLQRKKQLKI